MRIVDVGCGRGDLTIALAGALPAADVWGVDVNAESLAAAAAAAAALSNVRFDRVSAAEVASRASGESAAAADAGGAAAPRGGVIIYCALHACGGLADLTAAMAVAHRADGRVAGFICCTCCFCSYAACRSHGIAGVVAGAPYADAVCGGAACAAASAGCGNGKGGARGADGAAAGAGGAADGGTSDASSDAERAGGCGGAWGLAAGDVGRLTRLAELEAADVRAAAMHSVNALRLGALEMAARAPLSGGGGGGGRLEAAALLAMPEEYTPRNLVIRGVIARGATRPAAS